MNLIRDPLAGRLSHGHFRRGGFRTVDLNAVGWSALVGLGLVIGAAIMLTTALPLVVTAPIGVIATWGTLLLLDYRRWRSSTVGLGNSSLNAAIADQIIARLQAMGITATYREQIIDDEDESQRSIECRWGDAERVWKVMHEVMYPPPKESSPSEG